MPRQSWLLLVREETRLLLKRQGFYSKASNFTHELEKHQGNTAPWMLAHLMSWDSLLTNLSHSLPSCASPLPGPDSRITPIKTRDPPRWQPGRLRQSWSSALRRSISCTISCVLATLSNRLRRPSIIRSCSASAAAELAARFSAALRASCAVFFLCWRRQ